MERFQNEVKEDVMKRNVGTKKHRKRLSKMRDMKIRNSDRITKLALRELNKETKKCERKNKIGTTNNDV